MSKKSKHKARLEAERGPVVADNGEYQVIKHDLVRVVVINLMYLLAILAVYYTNAQSRYLEKWLFSLLNF